MITTQEKIFETVTFTASIKAEDKTNAFLDSINLTQDFLSKTTPSIIILTEKLEEFSWFENVTEQNKFLIKIALLASKELTKGLSKSYVVLKKLYQPKNVLKEELKQYKEAIENLQETTNDIEMVFFELPNDTEFKAINEKLASL